MLSALSELLVLLLLLPNYNSAVQCTKSKICNDSCYQQLIPEGRLKRGCLWELEDKSLITSCCLEEKGCLVGREDNGPWFQNGYSIAIKCCSGDYCLNQSSQVFSVPNLSHRFYGRISYYTFFSLILVLTTVLGKEMSLKATGIQSLERVRTTVEEITAMEETDRMGKGVKVDNKWVLTLGEHSIYQRGGHDMVLYARVMPTRYEAVLHQMLEHGPGSFSMDAVEVNEVLVRSCNIFAAESSLLEINSPCVVIGEIRASYPDLFRWLQVTGFPPKNKLLFLGGVFDASAPGAIETLTLIAAFKATLPYDVFVIRGVKELLDYQFVGRYPPAVSNALRGAVNRMCSQLPVAALIDNKILAVHSGISNKIKSLNLIKKIRRPIHPTHIPALVKELIFSMPNREVSKRTKIKGGTGYWYPEETVSDVCAQLDLEMIMRGRGPSQKGYFLFANRRLLSLWSSIGDREGCSGSAATVEPGGQVKLHTIQWTPSELEVVFTPSVVTPI